MDNDDRPEAYPTLETMKAFNQRRCTPCEGDTPAMTSAQIAEAMPQVPHWSPANSDDAIERKINTKTFAKALELINAIGQIAEDQQHHPDLHLTGYRHLRIVLTTHAIGGLSENDFIIAAKFDERLSQNGR